MERGWQVHQPCFTTFELEELAQWLTGCADGKRPDREWLEFMEPLIQIVWENFEGGNIHLRVLLDHEALPPWEDRDSREDEMPLEFHLSSEELLEAARDLKAQLERFPFRSGT